MKKSLIVLVCCMASILTACASLNPFAAADGPDEQGYAALGTYRVFQRQALAIASDTTLPPNIRLAVADADKAAVPILADLDKALDEYLTAKAALDAGTTTQDKVAIAIANLNGWTKKAKEVVTSLKKVVATARKAKTASTAAPSHHELRYA